MAVEDRRSDDHYETLGIPADAHPGEVTAAYRRLVRDLHPDTNPDPAVQDRFRAVSDAYRVLGDRARRAAYDGTLARGGRATPRTGGGYRIPVRNLTPREPDHTGLRAGATARRQPTGATEPEPQRVDLTFAQAALGTELRVRDVDGTMVRVRIPAGVQPGQVLRVPRPGAGTSAGRELRLRIHVVVPTDLDDRQRRLIEELAAIEETDPH